MAIFQADCPHCGTKKVALAIQHEFKCVKTTTFLRQGASAGHQRAVGSMQAEWKDHRETEPSATES